MAVKGLKTCRIRRVGQQQKRDKTDKGLWKFGNFVTRWQTSASTVEKKFTLDIFMNNENSTSSVGAMRGSTWIVVIKGIRGQTFIVVVKGIRGQTFIVVVKGIKHTLSFMVKRIRGQNWFVMVNGIRRQNLIVMVNGPIDRMQANFHVQNLNTICTHTHTRTHTRTHARNCKNTHASTHMHMHKYTNKQTT